MGAFARRARPSRRTRSSRAARRPLGEELLRRGARGAEHLPKRRRDPRASPPPRSPRRARARRARRAPGGSRADPVAAARPRDSHPRATLPRQLPSRTSGSYTSAWMGRILNRYLFMEILVPFFFGLAVFTFILLIARILKLVELVVNRGVPLLDILKTFSLILPAFLEVTVPMALLLAILLGFGRLASDSEVVALKTSGVSLYQMTIPVAAFTVLAFAATFVIAMWVRPWANGALRQQMFEVVKSRVSAGFKEKVFNADFPGLVIYIEEIEPGGGTLKGILIADSRRPDNRSTVIAKIGLLVPNEAAKTVTLRLLDGTIYGVGGSANAFQKTDFTVYDVSLALTNLGEMRPREKDPKEMTLAELSDRISERRAAHQPAYEEQIELHRKF